MRVLLPAFGSRKGVEPMEGLALWLGASGAEARVCAPPDRAAAEGCDAPIATGAMPTGGWR